MTASNILELSNVYKDYPIKGGILGRTIATVKAVRGVSLKLKRGETLGLVGESGCGKSTLGRSIIRLENPTSGKVFFDEVNILSLSKKELRRSRNNFQMIFQDPFSSLNPKMTINRLIGEPIRLHSPNLSKEETLVKIKEIMKDVGLPEEALNRYPHEFSGGQRQRISIGRALAASPKLIVCDEPVSALDVSIQAQILNLLMDLQQKYQLSYVFISHDLTVVKHVSHKIAVMYLGQIVEYADNDALFKNACHPYTIALLSAIPTATIGKKSQKPLTGDVPSPLKPPSGCSFHPRCPYKKEICTKEEPTLTPVGEEHAFACFFPRNQQDPKKEN